MNRPLQIDIERAAAMSPWGTADLLRRLGGPSDIHAMEELAAAFAAHRETAVATALNDAAVAVDAYVLVHTNDAALASAAGETVRAIGAAGSA